MQQRTKQILIITGVIFGIIIAYNLFTLIQNSGKTAVTIQVLPQDASITIDAQSSHAGKVFVAPGTHTFKATKNGYKEDVQTVTIGKDPATVILLPTGGATSADTLNLQLQREAQGGSLADTRGKSLAERNPIISHLPYPFDQPYVLTPRDYEINYEVTNESKTGVRIKINGVDSIERQAALEQIRIWGYDPSDMDIQFIDFKNPLTGGN